MYLIKIQTHLSQLSRWLISFQYIFHDLSSYCSLSECNKFCGCKFQLFLDFKVTVELQNSMHLLLKMTYNGQHLALNWSWHVILTPTKYIIRSELEIPL